MSRAKAVFYSTSLAGGCRSLKLPKAKDRTPPHGDALSFRMHKKYPNPFGFEYELYGGELGTRTPDPLRVMHDDFLIFRAMIR